MTAERYGELTAMLEAAVQLTYEIIAETGSLERHGSVLAGLLDLIDEISFLSAIENAEQR